MEVKGSAVIATPLFIKENFGEEEFSRWLSLLSEEARTVYSRKIDTSKWYPLKSIFSLPTQTLCDLFYEGNLRGAWACGMFSAEYGLQGFFRFWVRLGSPGFIISRASEIIASYYRPSSIKVICSEKTRVVLRITSFPDIDPIVEARICGWIEQALRINGCNELLLAIEKSLTKKDQFTEIAITWKQ